MRNIAYAVAKISNLGSESNLALASFAEQRTCYQKITP